MADLIIGNNYYVDNPGAKSFVGRLTAIIDPFTVSLEDASWVSDSGYLSDFIKNGKANNMEIEPVGNAPRVRYQAIIEWPHELFYREIPNRN